MRVSFLSCSSASASSSVSSSSSFLVLASFISYPVPLTVYVGADGVCFLLKLESHPSIFCSQKFWKLGSNVPAESAVVCFVESKKHLQKH